jgi:cell division protein YceG involved in septum cleavage
MKYLIFSDLHGSIESMEKIIETMLKQTDKILSKYQTTMTKSVHYYVTMASMAELEGTNTDNRKQIVSVFENRLTRGMNLGSDVTTYYAVKVDMSERDLYLEEINDITIIILGVVI